MPRLLPPARVEQLVCERAVLAQYRRFEQEVQELVLRHFERFGGERVAFDAEEALPHADEHARRALGVLTLFVKRPRCAHLVHHAPL